MVKTVFSIGLSTGENLVIKKNRLEGTGGCGKGKRVAVVSGIHGDELEGQYVCYEIVRRIKERPGLLDGTVDIYPALNPIGITVASRKIPKLDMDMNRMFPGDEKGAVFERVAAAIIQDMNVDMVWTNATETVHEATLAHSMNCIGVPTLVVEMGLGMRVNRSYGRQVVEGIFNLLYELGIWKEQPKNIQYPVLSTDGEVEFIRADCSGVFIPSIEHNHFVKKGDKIGEIITPIEGTVEREIIARKDGLVFTLREYPMVSKGSLLARILTDIRTKEGE